MSQFNSEILVVEGSYCQSITDYSSIIALFETGKIFLRREPNNKYDSNAILVVVADLPSNTMKDLGYIAKKDAVRLAPILDSGSEYQCESYEVSKRKNTWPLFKVQLTTFPVQQQKNIAVSSSSRLITYPERKPISSGQTLKNLGEINISNKNKDFKNLEHTIENATNKHFAQLREDLNLSSKSIDSDALSKSSESTDFDEWIQDLGYNQAESETAIQDTINLENKIYFKGVHPWRRFFARTVDFMLLGIPIWFLLFFLIGSLFPYQYYNSYAFATHPIGSLFIGYGLWLVIEAFLLSIGGTTPAKWIFGIRVVNRTGEKLSYRQAFTRAFLVNLQGNAFDIPPIALITRICAYNRLKKTGTTLWDTSVDAVVMHKKMGVIRIVACIFTVLVALVFIGILDKIGN